MENGRMSREEYEVAEGISGGALTMDNDEQEAMNEAEVIEYVMTVIVSTTNAYIETLVENGLTPQQARELAQEHCITFYDIINLATAQIRGDN